MKRLGFAWLAALLTGVPAILAQSSGPLSFEVASVKKTPPEWTRGRYIRMQTAQQFLAKNHAVNTLIAAAWNVSPRAIFGISEAWIEADHYDITAKTPGQTRPALDQQMAMLRQLMTERFGLTFHREMREMPYYALTVGKAGHKLGPRVDNTPAADGPPEGPPPLVFVIERQLVRLPAQRASMADLASIMQRAALDRPVMDKTGLAGRYDFKLEWTPDESQFGGMLGKQPPPDANAKPELTVALQEQLGLKLTAARGPLEVFVIDKVSRPTEN